MVRTLVAALVLFLAGSGTAKAQILEQLAQGGGAAYYRIVDAEDIPIQIKVWGSVASPGLYEVPRGLHLSTLLTLAGGPMTGQQGSGSRRTLTLRLYRPQPGGSHHVVFETQMQDAIFVLEQDPELLPGDILIVEEHIRSRFGWRDGISLVTALGTLILIVERLINLGN